MSVENYYGMCMIWCYQTKHLYFVTINIVLSNTLLKKYHVNFMCTYVDMYNVCECVCVHICVHACSTCVCARIDY